MSVDDAFDADVAVVGMAGRFPGARDVDAFWKNSARASSPSARARRRSFSERA
jgi:acyl transferase domain-containing protein